MKTADRIIPEVKDLRGESVTNGGPESAVKAQPRPSNPLDLIPNEMPFDVPYGRPISLEWAEAAIDAAVAEAKKRNWKMNVAVTDSGGHLVAFQRMDGAMLASIQIAEHKARAAATFRRPTKIFEDGIQLTTCVKLLVSPISNRSQLSVRVTEDMGGI